MGLCALHREWYSDIVCMDCGIQLTEDTYAEVLIAVGPPAEPWQDPQTFDVARQVADRVDVVCTKCKQVRQDSETPK